LDDYSIGIGKLIKGQYSTDPWCPVTNMTFNIGSISFNDYCFRWLEYFKAVRLLIIIENKYPLVMFRRKLVLTLFLDCWKPSEVSKNKAFKYTFLFSVCFFSTANVTIDSLGFKRYLLQRLFSLHIHGVSLIINTSVPLITVKVLSSVHARWSFSVPPQFQYDLNKWFIVYDEFICCA
jgi:hypothetical protein